MNKPMTVDQMSKSTPVLGILSIVFGGISMLPLLGIVSPLGVILGIIALVKKQKITGVIGTSISVVGVATSPLLWALVLCLLNPESEACKPKEPLKVEQTQPAQNVTPTAPATSLEQPSTIQNPAEQPPSVEATPVQPAPVQQP